MPRHFPQEFCASQGVVAHCGQCFVDLRYCRITSAGGAIWCPGQTAPRFFRLPVTGSISEYAISICSYKNPVTYSVDDHPNLGA
jgi:hypothetical protein